MRDLDGSSGTDRLELIGRTAEFELMKSFVGRAFGHGDALLLTGEAGGGKTVLLDAACRIAATEGAQILRAAGVPFEAEVGFAGLNQLFLSLRDRLDTLSELHREALSAALGMGTGPTVGPLVVSTAALALLRDVAEREPVLVVVDDAQWLDRSSAGVLGSSPGGSREAASDCSRQSGIRLTACCCTPACPSTVCRRSTSRPRPSC
jgi:hypothetical protein